MAVRVKPELITELAKYGAEDVQKCYHCGNCSATCPFSQEPFVLPRRSMRYLQMGLEESLRGNLEPWLCYYCGECSEQCPRGAEPGETMMSLRRWLTSRYDFTGLASLFYRSTRVEIAVLLLVALLTGAGMLVYGFTWGGGSLGTFDDGPAGRPFLPASAIHVFDWALGGTFMLILIVNIVRMWHFTMRAPRAPHVAASAYLRQAFVLPLHFFTQKRWSACQDATPWRLHLGLMLGYVTMLVLVMFFLEPLQHGPEIRWEVHVFGYLASAGLLAGTFYALRGRLKRDRPSHRHSHGTDWVFLVLLIVVVVTGVLLHAVHRLGFDAAANVMYVVHMMAVVPWLARYPFTKWSHLAYRPLAMYFAALQTEALLARRAARDAEAPAAGLAPVA
jgi:ferredoxin